MSDIKKISDTITEIDGKVRIESGPARLRAKATKELLSDDVTATHYKVGAIDAVGKKIELGKEMTYIDWKSRDVVFYIYKLGKDDEGVQRWLPAADPQPNYESALTKALALV